MAFEYLFSYLGLFIHISCVGLIIHLASHLEEDELASRCGKEKFLEDNLWL